MAKIVSEKQVNAFVKGLITEANPLTFPENASLDELNMDIQLDGSRIRRLGVDYEIGHQLNATGLALTTLQNTKQSAHRWDFPGGVSNIVFGVIRIGSKIWFLNLLAANPSANLLNGGIPITVASLNNADIDTAVVNNFFIITSKDLARPILLTYNGVTDVVSQEALPISVRDIWGVDDTLAIDTRPSVISATHRYNLKNQGWNTKVQTTTGADGIDVTVSVLGVYPSNADIWTYGKVGDSNSANFEKYDPARLAINSIDNSAVSRGSFILDAFSRGASRTTLSGVAGLPADLEAGTLTTVASYASRVFYSGITSSITGSDVYSPNYSGYIFFSQVALDKSKLTKCYQEADPTSPNISDIIDTDGGTIQIPEASRIVKLISAKASLIVLAENGVWEIYGDTGGFKATSFQMSKITSIGVTNPKAVVDANGTIIYWSKSGIFALTLDQATGRYISQSISLTTIQTYYNNIPELAKQNARGFYDAIHNHVRWLFNTDASYSEVNYINNYNRELNFDMSLNAFYPYKINQLVTNSPIVCDYIPIPGHSLSSLTTNVVDSAGVIVTDSLGAPVTTTVQVSTPRTATYNFLTLSGTNFTLSGYRNTTFTDWVTADGIGIDYTSYILTGYEIMGDVMRNKQVPYILFYLDRTENGFELVGGNLELKNQSSCLVQAQWNWTNSINSGKWSPAFQAYRFLRPYTPTGLGDPFDYGDRVIVTKSKLRGSGRALSLLISSEPKKDMKLLGWATEVTGDSKP